MTTKHTITSSIQIHYATNAHIDHTKEALILLLELLLVKDLNREDALFIHTPMEAC